MSTIMTGSSGKRRPNFLLIVTDQQRADHLGCYGNALLKTPHIDALAATGVRAENFYVANTSCMPNRATLMTGRMPSVHGVVHNGINLDRNHVTFVELLQSVGYSTGLIGKSHLQSFGYDGPLKRSWINQNGGEAPVETLRDAHKNQRNGPPYSCEWTPDWKAGLRKQVDTPYYGFDYVDLCTLHGDQVQGNYADWLAQQHYAPDTLRGPENAFPAPGYSAPQAWRTRLPEELYPSAYVGQQTCEWLTAHAARDAEKPFFLQCSFPDPHHPFTPPGRYWDMYSPDDVTLPATFREGGRSALVQRIHAYTQAGGSREGTAPFSVSERECREIIALTYGMIAMIDDQVGQILSTLERLSMDENTVVIFTSDHGDFMGDHGVVLKGPIHHQGLVRVPFIWRDHELPNERLGATLKNVSGSVDVAQTILDRAQVAPYNGVQGVSLLSGLRSSAPMSVARAGIVIESEAAKAQPGNTSRFRLRSLITEGARLTVATDPALCELYDLNKDPGERENLWSKPEARAQRDELSQQLLAETMRLVDTSPLPAAVA